MQTADAIITDLKGSILLVDDETTAQKLYSHVLQDAGYLIEVAANLQNARKLIHTFAFDTILADIFVGDENGLSFLKASLKAHPDTPVIMMTGAPSVQTASKAIRNGAYDYLCKPVARETLLNSVRRAVDLKLLREEKKHYELENRKYQQDLEKLIDERTQALYESETRYRLLFESCKDAIYICSREGAFVEFNQATIDLFGYDRKALLELQAESLYVFPQDRFKFTQAIETQGYVSDYPLLFRRKDGAPIDCLVTATVRIDDDGRVCGSQGIIRDITRQKQAEQRIHRQNKFLKNVLESLAHPFLVIDANTYEIRIANSAARLENIREGEPCYKVFHGLRSPCHQHGVRCTIEQVKRSLLPVRLEHVHKNSKGDDKHCEIHGYPIFDDRGGLTQIIQCHQDITEQAQARQQLQRLGTAIEQSTESIAITDRNGMIEYVNPTFEKITGYARNEAKGRKITFVSDTTQAGDRSTDMWSAIAKGQVWTGKVFHQRKDGSRFEEETVLSPVKEADGQIHNYVAITRDVTEKKRLESIAEAANLMDNLGYIFAGIRHEIGNPLNSIKMALTVLNKNLKNYSIDRIGEFVERSLIEVARVEYLLKAFKNFSLFERPRVKAVRIDQFMEHLLALVRDDFEKRGIRIGLNIVRGVEWAHTDSRALHQVMLNLLTNSADALREQQDPQINIYLHRDQNLVLIAVQDNGCGLNEPELAKLFQPFYTTKEKGTGLGLVIVKKMLAKMNSTIRVESQKHKGTVVTLALPEAQGEDE